GVFGTAAAANFSASYADLLNYWDMQSSGAGGTLEQILPTTPTVGMTLTGIWVKADAAPGAAKSFDVVVQLDGVDTALALNLGAAATAAYLQTDVAVAAGTHTIKARARRNGTAPAATTRLQLLVLGRLPLN
ncbi:MAG TPA: hypothetical protein VFU47_12330, partial [Armatimonadota bacterium]|nr:hypothetical protein [Armatimonadota bacterium]